ncbi:P-loop containing nucleoside triphosphate hydrolase protein, partial [Gaertneriomyces semiglobifer]
LDVKDIKFVINYDFPNNIEDYIHRIGRTGRAKTTGTAYTFFTPDNYKHARELVRILEEAHQDVDPKLKDLAHTSGGDRFGGGRGGSRGYRPSGGHGGSGGGYGSGANRYDPYRR